MSELPDDLGLLTVFDKSLPRALRKARQQAADV